METINSGNSVIVRDDKDPVVILGTKVVAEANPEEVPILSVGRREGSFSAIAEEKARTFGEVYELRLDPHVPVRVVFEDES